ncbi:hypothetical protein L218DRAFT_946534 [Marasmius fiardii PR-910]|nr:hypothetical protein L218DRAFT_946534 [Marasmius fiardii PR-910]
MTRARYQGFKGWKGLSEHYRQSPLHFYCKPCDEFSSAKELDNHFHFDVPNSNTCIPLALIMHFESGTCGTGIRIAEVDQVARGQDRGEVFSNHGVSRYRGEKPFFCPLEGDDVRFATLGALCQHFELSCEVGKMVKFGKILDGLISRVILKSRRM